jgi:hypothetical protein
MAYTDRTRDDRSFWEAETREMIDAAVDEVLGEQTVRTIETAMFDGVVTIAHDEEHRPPEDVQCRLARALREGRDFDPTKPSDWHFTSVGRVHERDREGEQAEVGTRVGLSRSFAAPQGYREMAS